MIFLFTVGVAGRIWGYITRDITHECNMYLCHTRYVECSVECFYPMRLDVVLSNVNGL